MSRQAVAHVLFGVADELTRLNVIVTSCETLPFSCDHAYSKPRPRPHFGHSHPYMYSQSHTLSHSGPTLRQLYLAGNAICTADWNELKALVASPLTHTPTHSLTHLLARTLPCQNNKPGSVSEDKLRKTCFATAYVVSVCVATHCTACSPLNAPPARHSMHRLLATHCTACSSLNAPPARHSMHRRVQVSILTNLIGVEFDDRRCACAAACACMPCSPTCFTSVAILIAMRSITA